MKRAKLKSLIQKNKDGLFDMQYFILTNEYCWWMRTYLGYDEDYIKPNKKYEKKKQKINLH